MAELFYISFTCAYFGEERWNPPVEASRVVLPIKWVPLRIPNIRWVTVDHQHQLFHRLSVGGGNPHLDRTFSHLIQATKGGRWEKIFSSPDFPQRISNRTEAKCDDCPHGRFSISSFLHISPTREKSTVPHFSSSKQPPMVNHCNYI